ncbi:molybdenum ABC transporter ATP-binding protein [Hyphococcus flavus]|uniref:Molybdenum ABC transporter ATP-binding protein n=1 Tax=Hyphococcus flavus TaxID=1866326 RepID=A0AAE9ZFF0_9PROT|nr:molybdenum ABC transporter ATP-binding protein [Hyphococcus flavus]WDI31742.1 molybdenum ABC transporter ATP-binding protein [Hyphococcus flavus]
MSDETLSIDIEKKLSGFTLLVKRALPLAGATAVFGPSGAGKTMLMRLIAGFEPPDKGRIKMGGTVWCDADKKICLAPHVRPVGYMFQEGRLFSHLSVRGNLNYAEKRNTSHEKGYTQNDIINSFALSSLLERRIQTLSGGERQRVALARTLLSRPKLLLLDEPLAALDRKRKNEILPYLKDLPAKFGVPTIFISHDIEEVSQLADQVLVLLNGRVQEYDSALKVISNLDLEPLTGHHESSALLEGVVSGHDQRLLLTRVSIGDASLTLPINADLAAGSTIRLRIKAQDVAIATSEPHDISIRNVIPGKIRSLQASDQSPYVETLIDIGHAQLRAQITQAATEALNLEDGKSVFALIKSVRIDGGR